MLYEGISPKNAWGHNGHGIRGYCLPQPQPQPQAQAQAQAKK